MNILKNTVEHFVGAGHLREQVGDSFVGAGHARDCFFVRGHEKLLMELLAIPLDCQKTTAKWLVMFGHPHGPLVRKFFGAT
jgi:hypothetical protein